MDKVAAGYGHREYIPRQAAVHWLNQQLFVDDQNIVTTQGTFQVLNLKHQGKSMWFWRANQPMEWFRHNSSEAYQQQRHEQRSTWTGPTTVSLKHQRFNSPPGNQGGKAKDTDAWAGWNQQQHSNKGWNWKRNQ